MRRGGWLQTYRGIAFYPLDPRPEDVDPLDIVHTLSMMPRYGGHTDKPYSVAQHSVYVSRRAGELTAGDLNTRRWGLLHDATEAYMVDLPTPIKRCMPEYVDAEERLMAVIAQRFGLTGHMPAAVKVADKEMLASEADVFFPYRPSPWAITAKPVPGYLPTKCLPFDEAWDLFFGEMMDLGLSE